MNKHVLGNGIHKALDKCSCIEIKKQSLARLGIPYPSKEYAAWLRENKLRMMQPRKDYIPLKKKL